LTIRPFRGVIKLKINRFIIFTKCP
ncbi:hypothetical protein D039_3313B, partial [Vibrio parahaemolyticus EKP-028]